jgi:hypothetical protein
MQNEAVPAFEPKRKDGIIAKAEAVGEENFERGLREARQDCRMAADVVSYFGARVA